MVLDCRTERRGIMHYCDFGVLALATELSRKGSQLVPWILRKVLVKSIPIANPAVAPEIFSRNELTNIFIKSRIGKKLVEAYLCYQRRRNRKAYNMEKIPLEKVLQLIGAREGGLAEGSELAVTGTL
jgi:hypothetical protein